MWGGIRCAARQRTWRGTPLKINMFKIVYVKKLWKLNIMVNLVMKILKVYLILMLFVVRLFEGESKLKKKPNNIFSYIYKKNLDTLL